MQQNLMHFFLNKKNKIKWFNSLVDAGIKYKRYCSDRTCTSVVDFEKFNF